MSTTQTHQQAAQKTTDEQDWRGVAADGQEVDARVGALLQARSRRLLGDLIRPHRRWIWLLIAIVLVENASRLSIPYLVKEGISPPFLAYLDVFGFVEKAEA